MGFWTVLLLSLFVSLNTAAKISNGTVSDASDDDIGLLRSYMTVQVTPASSSEWMRVECWSGTGNNNRDSGNTYQYRSLSWDFNSGPSTKFWCKASRQNSQLIYQFPVFGDGVPKKSSVWRVDASGKVRYSEDNKVKNDYRGSWRGTAITTTTTKKPTTTTTKPTTTTTRPTTTTTKPTTTTTKPTTTTTTTTTTKPTTTTTKPTTTTTKTTTSTTTKPTTTTTTTTKPTTTTTTTTKPTTTTTTTTKPTTTTTTTTKPTTTPTEPPTTSTPTTVTQPPPTTTEPLPTTSSTTEPPSNSPCPKDDLTEAPEPCPRNESSPIYMPNPYNCGRFFQCSDGVPVCLECANGTIWNDTLKICDSENNTECVIVTTTSNPTDLPTTTISTDAPTTNTPAITTTVPITSTVILPKVTTHRHHRNHRPVKEKVTIWTWIRKLRY